MSADEAKPVGGVAGRVALVTGASRGIGRTTAELLASRGASVMCAARDEKALQELSLDYVVADLGPREGCELAITATEERLGPLDILVCNHGIGSAVERVIWEQDPDLWDETMRINLDGPFHLSRLAVSGMVERGYGRVINVSSFAGRIARPAGSNYGPAKAYLIALSEELALELTRRPARVAAERADALQSDDVGGVGVEIDGADPAADGVEGLGRGRTVRHAERDHR